MDKINVNRQMLEKLFSNFFASLEAKEVDTLLEVNKQISFYLSDKYYNHIFKYIYTLLNKEEKSWLYKTLTELNESI